MQLKLSDNIKKHRKEMGLTQEGLADAIGVTIGAVSKWEKGANVPDIITMMELANFFNISLDELVGYDMSSKNIDAMCQRIDSLSCDHRFDEAIKEANDAMARYPHAFKVLHTCAEMYNRKTMESYDSEDAQKAIDLFETALLHIVQNRDNGISEYSIKIRIASLYRKIDPEIALEKLKEINYDGVNSNAIALVLMDMGKTAEALDNLTVALLQNFADQNTVVYNTAWALSKTGKKSDLEKAIELLETSIVMSDVYGYSDRVSYMYKLRMMPMIVKACLYSFLGDSKSMEACVLETRELARKFDEADVKRDLSDFFKFYFTSKSYPAYDASGTDAATSIAALLQRKMEEETGKKKKCIQKVIDAWNSAK